MQTQKTFNIFRYILRRWDWKFCFIVTNNHWPYLMVTADIANIIAIFPR